MRVFGTSNSAYAVNLTYETYRQHNILLHRHVKGPIKLVRRGGIYFDVPPQCSTPDTAHGQWVRRYGYSSSS